MKVALRSKQADRPLPERVSPGDILLLGVATHKLSRLLAKDWVTSFYRAPFTEYQGSATAPAEVRDAFLRNYHCANRWHLAAITMAEQMQFLEPQPEITI